MRLLRRVVQQARHDPPPRTCRARPRGGKRRLLHLPVEALHAPEYRLHVEVPASAALDSLDGLLRSTWLECCGHVSAFTLADGQYGGGWGARREIPMRARLGLVFEPGTVASCQYDFGSMTHLTVRCVETIEGRFRANAAVVARNEPPDLRCRVCGEPAKVVCTECVYDAGRGLCCAAHALNHGGDAEQTLLLPV